VSRGRTSGARAKCITGRFPVISVIGVSLIDSLPADKYALHDIRFRFRVNNIWTVISTNHPELRPNAVSKDISLEPLETHNLTIKTTIHHTDTVSVIVACPHVPSPLQWASYIKVRLHSLITFFLTLVVLIHLDPEHHLNPRHRM
jgi:hypothetical protein